MKWKEKNDGALHVLQDDDGREIGRVEAAPPPSTLPWWAHQPGDENAACFRALADAKAAIEASA